MRTLFIAITLAVIMLLLAVIMVSAQQYKPHYLFKLSITITNASYIYYYDIQKITVMNYETLNLVYVDYDGSGLYNVWIYISNQYGQYVATLHVIDNSKINDIGSSVSLMPGTYYVSVLIQPSSVVHYNDNSTLVLTFVISK
ncbi:MAG: hypothetical protein ACP5GY_05105 [Vulcanisaeta sp.]